MQPGIHLSKVWFDADVVELDVGVSDGTSFFSNRVYVGHDHLAGNRFCPRRVQAPHLWQPVCRLRFGGSGPSMRTEEFHARLRWNPGRLYIMRTGIRVQGVRQEEGRQQNQDVPQLPSHAPFDRFVAELQSLASGASNDAHLEAITAMAVVYAVVDDALSPDFPLGDSLRSSSAART